MENSCHISKVIHDNKLISSPIFLGEVLNSSIFTGKKEQIQRNLFMN